MPVISSARTRALCIPALLLVALATGGCGDLLEGDLAAWIVQRRASGEDNFRRSRSVRVLLEPADRGLYRELLPAQFDMPRHPMLSLAVEDNIEVGPWPLTRYQLGAVKLRCAWQGEEGWHVLSMPENHWIAIISGRTMGFPKYRIAVRLEQEDGGWTGEVGDREDLRLRLSFRPDRDARTPAWKREQWEMGGPTFNLMPPGEGPVVRRIGSVAGTADSNEISPGLVRITIAASEPWHGLVPADTEAPGSLVQWKGGRSLDPGD